MLGKTRTYRQKKSVTGFLKSVENPDSGIVK